MSTMTSVMSKDVQARMLAALEAKPAQSPDMDRTGRIAMSGPCRLTKKERRAGESKAFRNRREKSRSKAKMAKASRKRK